MMAGRRRYLAVMVGQWLLLTIALASVVVRATDALRDYVTPTFGDIWLIVAAFVFAALHGAMVSSARWLALSTFLMCAGATAIFAAVIYLPAWQRIIPHSIALQNFATQQALVLLIWILLPAYTGAYSGHVAAAGLREAAMPSVRAGGGAWWDASEGSEG